VSPVRGKTTSADCDAATGAGMRSLDSVVGVSRVKNGLKLNGTIVSRRRIHRGQVVSSWLKASRRR